MDIRVAAYGLIVKDSRILLAHWNQNGHSGWTLPGGGLEPGEDPADAARREVTEETGYVAELERILGVHSLVIPEAERFSGVGPVQAVRIVYRARIVGGDLRNESAGSTDEAAWFALDDVSRLDRVSLVDTALSMLDER